MASFLQETFGLDDRVALVTGSTRGLGRAVAEALYKAGATVFINGRSEISTAKAAQEIRESVQGSGKVYHVAASVATQEGAKHAVQEVISTCGRLDILVNNAGVNLPQEKPFDAQTADEFDLVLLTNVHSVTYPSMLALPALKQSDQGRIINLGSIGDSVGLPGNSGYCASKGGVRLLTQTMAMELGETSVNVNCVSPGVFATDMNKKITEDEEVKKSVVSGIPLGRLGRPQELGPAVVFLSSAASSYVTGTCLYVDGGFTAGK
eukprot:m.184904 g.184904  ORF g.184904 m.184904 type:complete len:264 (-) comp18107_c1_seq2:99-890(-)